jgi:hypothetical protein
VATATIQAATQKVDTPYERSMPPLLIDQPCLIVFANSIISPLRLPFSKPNNVMPRTHRPQWDFPCPGSTVQDRINLADDLKSLHEGTVTVQSERVRVRLPLGVIKPRPCIDGVNNDCLSQKLTFVPSLPPTGNSDNTEPSAGERKGQVILEYKESDKHCASRIKNVTYKGHGDGKISLHNPDLKGRHMIGGEFEGGTQVNSTRTPGLFSLEGATFKKSMHLNREYDHYESWHDQEPINTSMVQSRVSERTTAPNTAASVLNDAPKHKRQRKRGQSPSAGTSRPAAGTTRKSSDKLSDLLGPYKTMKQWFLEQVYPVAPPHPSLPISHLPQASSNIYPPSHFNPRNTDTTQQRDKSGLHSHNATMLSQSTRKQEELGEEMLKRWADEFYRQQRQDR